AMLQALPGTKNGLDARIDVVGRVGREDLIGRLFSPGYELIQKVIGRLAPIGDTVLCIYVVHTSSDCSFSNVSCDFSSASHAARTPSSSRIRRAANAACSE